MGLLNERNLAKDIFQFFIGITLKLAITIWIKIFGSFINANVVIFDIPSETFSHQHRCSVPDSSVLIFGHIPKDVILLFCEFD